MIGVLNPTSISRKNVIDLRENKAQSVVLSGVGWQTYESFMEAFPESHALHFAFADGDLEIMTLSFEHENFNRLIADLFKELALEFGIDFSSAGSLTLKRADLAKGFEPDSSFYVKNEPLVRGKKRIVLPGDPPPDLTIEVDIESSSLNRMKIFAAIGISEVWRFDGENLKIYGLTGNEYRESEKSLILPPVESKLLTAFIAESYEMSHAGLIKKVRNWAQKEVEKNDEKQKF